MFAKKEIPASSPVHAYRKELKYLYARRLAIDSLIESLEEYDRFRVVPREKSERRIA
jgi:hypothetical protein